jgi:hypothetical protein
MIMFSKDYTFFPLLGSVMINTLPLPTSLVLWNDTALVNFGVNERLWAVDSVLNYAIFSM